MNKSLFIPLFYLPLAQLARLEAQNDENLRTWYSEKDNDFTNNLPRFLSNHQIHIQGTTPYSFFIKIFSNDLFEHIATESIRYAMQNGTELRVSTAEIKNFFAINMIMSYIKYPEYRMYWSKNPGLRFNLIADTMHITKYDEIKRFLHFMNNDEILENNHDAFIKIRPFLDILAQTFANACTPSEYHIQR